jgi:hypothetical protein
MTETMSGMSSMPTQAKEADAGSSPVVVSPSGPVEKGSGE